VAVEAMKAGADDYVIKPRRAQRLATAVRLARERAQLRAREQEALRLRDAFLSIAEHELRTPLTILLGYLSLFQQTVAAGEVALGERDRWKLEVIVRQATALRRLVEHLSDVAWISTGVLSLEWQSVDLGALARRVVEEAGPLWQAHTLELACPADPLVVRGDPLRLAQGLQNLLNNAVTYSPGGPIMVALVRSGPRACLSVTDRGIGIPVAEQAQVFERFYRAGNVNPRRTSGFGLGLYVTRAIVQQHGGTITVESVQGQGSTFTLCLPLARSEEPSPAA
jgi:signal transduction histidine kinase